MATGDATVRLSRFTESTTPEAEIPMQIGSVRLVREIGRGGMGVVWLARHEILGRDVAVKFVLSAASAAPADQRPSEAREPKPAPPDAKTTPIPVAPTPDRDAPPKEATEGGAGRGAGGGADLPGNEMQAFIEGCRAAAAVRHPGLVEVYHADIVNRIPYLVMEYVDGPSLEGAIRRLGALSVPLALAIMEVTCDAVASLHDAGIIHRDIKPANLLITPEGQIEVTDFGLACERPAGKGHESVGLAGTPAYMAPEMFDGSISLKSDVYALGITLFEMLTGTVPYDGNLTTLENHHRASPLPSDLLKIKQVPAAIVEVIERATAKNPMLRSRTARHVVQALKLAVRDEKVWAQGKRELTTLVSRWRSAAVDEAREGAASQAQGTYYDHLSMRAERKRKFTPAPLEPGIEPLKPLSPSDESEFSAPGGTGTSARWSGVDAAEAPGGQKTQADTERGPIAAPGGGISPASPEPAASTGEAPGAIDAEGRLARHICCTQCAYDLFTQPENGMCPECATPIRESMSLERLAFADRVWLDRVQHGFGTMLIALGATPILLLATASSELIESVRGPTRLSAMLDVFGPAVAIGVLAFAGFRATPREPGPLKRASEPARLASRAGALVACGAVVADTVRLAVLGVYPFSTMPESKGAAAIGLGMLIAAGLLSAVVGLVAYSTSMIRTIPDAALAGYARLLYIAAALATLPMPMFTVAGYHTQAMSPLLLVVVMFLMLLMLALPCGLFAYLWACKHAIQRVLDPVKHPTQRRKPKFDDDE